MSSKILLQYPLQEIYLLVAKLELATGSKISSTDRQKLGHSSLKQFGGLTVPQIRTCKQNPNAPKRQIPFHWKS